MNLSYLRVQSVFYVLWTAALQLGPAGSRSREEHRESRSVGDLFAAILTGKQVPDSIYCRVSLCNLRVHSVFPLLVFPVLQYCLFYKCLWALKALVYLCEVAVGHSFAVSSILSSGTILQKPAGYDSVQILGVNFGDPNQSHTWY